MADKQKEKRGSRERFYSRMRGDKMVEMIDLFPRPMPSFNVRGRTAVSSYFGALLSFAIFFVMLIYGALKMIHLLSKHNPNLSTYTDYSYFDSKDVLNLRDKKIKVAFGIEGFLDKELKYDPQYVKNMVRLWRKQDGVESQTILPYHLCTNEELDEFETPVRESEAMIESIKQSEKRGLFCLDYDSIGDLSEIWGIEDDENYQRMELILLPCNYVHAEFGHTGDA